MMEMRKKTHTLLFLHGTFNCSLGYGDNRTSIHMYIYMECYARCVVCLTKQHDDRVRYTRLGERERVRMSKCFDENETMLTNQCHRNSNNNTIMIEMKRMTSRRKTSNFIISSLFPSLVFVSVSLSVRCLRTVKWVFVFLLFSFSPFNFFTSIGYRFLRIRFTQLHSSHNLCVYQNICFE